MTSQYRVNISTLVLVQLVFMSSPQVFQIQHTNCGKARPCIKNAPDRLLHLICLKFCIVFTEQKFYAILLVQTQTSPLQNGTVDVCLKLRL
jgi:hypothetical protein